jgi:activator of HSP90 ATPase
MLTRELKQEVLFNALPHDVFEILMDSKKHAKFTGGQAKISRKIGGKFSVWNGGINGNNIEIIPDKKIVQNWRTDDWPKDYFSKIIFSFRRVKNGTKLIFRHLGIPKDEYDDIKQGWFDYYWEPMKKMLEKG